MKFRYLPTEIRRARSNSTTPSVSRAVGTWSRGCQAAHGCSEPDRMAPDGPCEDPAAAIRAFTSAAENRQSSQRGQQRRRSPTSTPDSTSRGPGVEASRNWASANGLSLEPFGRVSTRFDGGAGQTGTGFEIEGGAASGGLLRAEAQARCSSPLGSKPTARHHSLSVPVDRRAGRTRDRAG